MVLKNVLDSLVLNYQEELKNEKKIKRNLNPKLQRNFATIISGIRRCGKSTLAKQLVKSNKTYYFNFENVQLAEFDQNDFVKLDKSFKEILGDKGIYLFDEIQNIVGWEIFVRQLVDRGEVVVVTGSNATMLSKELGTRLTGRNLRYELYPFSFGEFLEFKDLKPNIKSFEDYFVNGGFAEYLQSNNSDVLRNLFEDIFYRDILVRNDFRSESELKQFVAFISSNIGVEISYNKLKNLLGVGSVNTISQFVNACEMAYLFFEVNKFDFSLKKQQINPKKIYCVDNSLLRLNSFSFSENRGRYLENIVFIKLKSNKKQVFYHKNKKECDFVIKEDLKIVQAIQVCYSLNLDNEKREIDGLLDACKNYNLKKGLILTYDQEDELDIGGVKIIVKPVYKWLLEN